MAKATVLLDTYSWTTGKGEDRTVHDAAKGDVIDVSDAELKRGLGMNPQGLAEGEVTVRMDRSGLEALKPAEEPDLGEPSTTEKPAKSANRETWNAYASTLRAEDGSAAIADPASFSKKDELLDAVDKAEAAGASPAPPATAPVAPATPPAVGVDLPDNLLELDEAELIPLAKARGVDNAEEMDRDALIAEILGAPGASRPVPPQAVPGT